MMFLARKVSFAKWEPKHGVEKGEIPADAVTLDLRTFDNGLSLWKCEKASLEDVTQVALALAAEAERVDKIDVVWVEQSDLEDKKVILKNTDGKTPVASLVKNHVDALHLDLVRLGIVANSISKAFQEGHKYRFTEKKVRDILVEAVISKQVDLKNLKEKVRNDVAKTIAKK
jgi:hypothetical protein